ncbi:MAG: glycine betaine ABC transporter substrate-binding protein [Bacteroidales bacterium]
MKTHFRYNFTLIIASVFALFSCNYMNTADNDENKELRIVYTDWSESIALTHLSTVLLEEELGYTVVLKLTDVEKAYNEVAKGTADVFADAWLPETQKRYYTQHADNIEKLAISYPDARTGFVVPEYSDLQTIQDLQDQSGNIVGIDEGAGVMIKARKALQSISSSATLLTLNEAEMTTRLEEAIKRRENIVVTGWEPHWIFAKFNVRFLEDEHKIFGENEQIYTIAHTGFSETHPTATRFFERMQLSEKQLNQLVYEIRLHNDPEEGARAWIDKNEFVVNQWVKNLAPERKKIM